jgi:hypothetical protein
MTRKKAMVYTSGLTAIYIMVHWLPMRWMELEKLHIQMEKCI